MTQAQKMIFDSCGSVGLRIANFMDSALDALDRKGNLSHAIRLYNPAGRAESVVHFTPHSADIRFAKTFAEAGIEIFPFFDNRGGTLARMLRVPAALVRVAAKMRRERINLVRGRLPYFGSLIGCLCARLLGVPSVVSLGGDNRLPQEREGRYYFGSRALSYGMEYCVLRLADRIIAPNVFTRNYVARILGERAAVKKVHVIPWILDRGEKAAPVAEVDGRLGISGGKPVVAVIGHINRYKFSEEMFRVAGSLADEAQFVFCGDGPLRAEGEKRLSPAARFAGWQPNTIVLGLLQRADAVLIPMSGFVLLEAASLGRPVVTSNLEWHSELVEDGRSGLLVEAADTDAWIKAVKRLLSHPDEASGFGKRLAERFAKDYDPDRLVALELNLYGELLAA